MRAIGGRRGAAAALALVALAGAPAWAAPPGPDAPRAAPGSRLVQALEEAPLAVVGRVEGRRALDARAWEATLVVERVLAGPPPPGGRVAVAWEELAPSRAPRLAGGERVLVALEPIPDGSLWRRRLPPGSREGAWHLAGRGEAFLRAPSLASLTVLEHYLRLAPPERRGPTGSAWLAQLARDAEAPLAASAVAALGSPAREAEALDAAVAARLVDALARPEEPVREALLELVARRPTPPLRAALRLRVEAAARPPAVLVEALGRAEGGLDAARAGALLDDPAPARRAAAARHAPAEAADALAARVVSDRAPEVRAAAAERLIELRGEEGLDAALEALADPEESVRVRTAQAAAGLGAAAVPRLAEVAERWPQPAPQAAILALSLSQRPEAAPVLRRLADDHPDPAVRRLAAIALGRNVGHAH